MFSFFFFIVTSTTEIYTLSLHDALPIFSVSGRMGAIAGSGLFDLSTLFGKSDADNRQFLQVPRFVARIDGLDRKSTRLNSSHPSISYAVFCLKKKKINNLNTTAVT